MTNPFSSRSAGLRSKEFGLVGWLEQTRVRLPLKGVECQFNVYGDLLSVRVDQIFHQEMAEALNCLYSFPLPARAAVYCCEMHVNGRVIRGKVEERSRARRIMLNANHHGRRTAFVEVERDNLFSLSLGNVQPGDVVVIRFGYFETLSRLADWTSLRIPFCPGVRYIPGQPLLRGMSGMGVADDTDQVPDASRISPPRMDALHPDTAYLSVEGVIEDPLGTVTDVSSPSHPVWVEDGEKRFLVKLADRAAVPDSDFALRWTETRAENVHASAWAVSEGADTYALVLLQAPEVAAPVANSAQDFYFLVDRSGSMAGLKWEKAVQSFRTFLNHLGPEDRAWATFFSNHWRDFAERPLTKTELEADPGLPLLESLVADGGTEMLPALKHILEVIPRHSTGRTAALVLITDGQVGNEEAILTCLREYPDVCVHTFGIDTAVNDALLTRLADQQRGSSCLLQPTDDIVGAVTRLGTRLRLPVVTSIAACDGWELPDRTAPDLHSQECVSLSLKLGSPNAEAVVLKGRLPDGREKSFRFPLVRRAEAAIRLLWVRDRIRYCQEQKQGEQAVALAKQHNLICKWASFIAWDGAEQMPIAQRAIYQTGAFYGAAPSGPETLADIKADITASGLPYRRRISYLISPVSVAQDRLKRLLANRPQMNREQFLTEFGLKLGRWYEQFIGSFAVSRSVIDNWVVDLLLEWVIDGGSDATRRLNCLGDLVNRLESQAPDPQSDITVALQWVVQSMLQDDDYRERAETMFNGITQRIGG